MDDYKSGHRNRIKAKYLENSANLVYDYEVLELLLTYSIPRRDVKPAAKALLERFGSLDKVFSASKEQLCTVNGIGENSAILIKLVTDLQSRCAKCRNLKESRLALVSAEPVAQVYSSQQRGVHRAYERLARSVRLV